MSDWSAGGSLSGKAFTPVPEVSAKKRSLTCGENHAALSKANQEKSMSSWQNFVAARSTIMRKMVPHGVNDNSIAFKEVANCFLTGYSTNSFHSFTQKKLEDWYCLRSVLSRGLQCCSKIDDRIGRCEVCRNADKSSAEHCVQVKPADGLVTFRVVMVLEM